MCFNAEEWQKYKVQPSLVGILIINYPQERECVWQGVASVCHILILWIYQHWYELKGTLIKQEASSALSPRMYIKDIFKSKCQYESYFHQPSIHHQGLPWSTISYSWKHYQFNNKLESLWSNSKKQCNFLQNTWMKYYFPSIGTYLFQN